MHLALFILSILLDLTGTVCWIFIIVEAFRDEIWKGILSVLCGPYWLYFAVFDWDHENKWPILLCALACGAASLGILRFG